MYWSKYFIPTLKETPIGTEAISHQLSLRASLVHMLTSGVYSYLPLGYKVLRKVENIIREEMDAIGCCELLLPSLHPLEVWKKTGRDQTLKEVMITFQNKKGQAMCLGPTHEEIITTLAKDFVQSYRQLPVTLYQIQTKFRDETRTRYGIVRASEFIMKDAYSFDRDIEGLNKNYQLQYEAYTKIFKRCGLNVIAVAADSGAMGGKVSHEFLVVAPIGEDAIWQNTKTGEVIKDEEGKEPKGEGWERKVAIELGHIFQLGTKYTDSLGAMFLDEDGKQKPMIMGCYGIGVSRLIAAIIELNSDQAGIIWPKEVAPFEVEILPVQASDTVSMELAQKYYHELKAAGVDVLLDDRDESAGRKFNDADLIGIPYRVIIGKRMLAQNQVEIKNRRTGQMEAVSKDNLKEELLKEDSLGMLEDKQRLLYDRINQIAQSLNLELVELKIGIHQKDVFLQVLADRPQGKIGIEECTQLNRSIVEAIDKEAFFSEDGYSLEVSSPGLDRPLATKKDFLRNLNAEVQIWLKEKVGGKIEYVGIIQSATDDSVSILVRKEKEAIIIPLDKVLKALLVI